MPYLMLTCSQSTGLSFTDDPASFAVVELDPELLGQLDRELLAVHTLREDTTRRALCLHVWDNNARYYDWSDALSALLGDAEAMLIDALPPLPEPLSTDVERRKVYPSEVSWTAYVKGIVHTTGDASAALLHSTPQTLAGFDLPEEEFEDAEEEA